MHRSRSPCPSQSYSLTAQADKILSKRNSDSLIQAAARLRYSASSRCLIFSLFPLSLHLPRRRSHQAYRSFQPEIFIPAGHNKVVSLFQRITVRRPGSFQHRHQQERPAALCFIQLEHAVHIQLEYLVIAAAVKLIHPVFGKALPQTPRCLRHLLPER